MLPGYTTRAIYTYLKFLDFWRRAIFIDVFKICAFKEPVRELTQKF